MAEATGFTARDEQKMITDAMSKAAEAEQAHLMEEVKLLEQEQKEGGGFKALQAAVKKLIPGKAKNDDEKNADKTPWQMFEESAKSMGDFWGRKFFPALNVVDLGPYKMKIAEICLAYFALLQETDLTLGKCRHSTENIANAMLGVFKVMKYSVKTFKKLDDDDRRERYAEQLSKKIGELCEAMKDETCKKEVIVLQGKWKKMSESITAIVNEVEKYIKDLKEKAGKKVQDAKENMSWWQKVAATACQFVGQVAMTMTGGLAGPVIKLFGDVMDSMGLPGSTIANMVLGNHYAPAIMGELGRVRDKAIKTIQSGLDHISAQSVQVDGMLHEIVKAFEELQKKQSLDDYKDPFELVMALEDDQDIEVGGTPLQELLQSLKEANDALKALVEAIRGSEDAIKVELREYPQKIHPKLLAMLHAKAK